jgi:membrane-associated phospholipid phosphatase
LIGGPLLAFVRRRFSREEAVGLSFTVSFLVSASLAVAIGLLAREVGRGSGWQESLDVRVSETLVGLRSPQMNAIMLAITFLGDQRFLLVATPAVAAALWLRRRHVSSILFSLSVLGGFGLNVLLKVTIGRARPDRWAVLVTETSPSFPSGHTLMATVFFGALAATVFHVSRNRLARILAVAVATAIVLVVASSRVYLGAHWATDTLAGMLAGSIWVVLYSATTTSVTRVRNRRLVDPGSS